MWWSSLSNYYVANKHCLKQEVVCENVQKWSQKQILTAELYSHVFRSPNLSVPTERLCDGVRNWTGLYSMTNLMQELEIDWLVNTLHMKKASQIDVRWSRNVAIWDSYSGIYQETSCRLQRRCHKNQTKPIYLMIYRELIILS